MALVWRDRVRESTSTTGTGALTLGGAPTGYRTFASVMSTGDTCYGFVAHRTQTQWEICLFTLQAGGTLARTTVLASSNANAAVSFTAGTKDVLLDVPASLVAQTAYLNAANTYVLGPQTLRPGADANKALVVKGHSATQSGSLLESQKSDGTVLMTAGPDGRLAVTVSRTDQDVADTQYHGIDVSITETAPANASRSIVHGGRFAARAGGTTARTHDFTGVLAVAAQTGAGSLPWLFGTFCNPQNNYGGTANNGIVGVYCNMEQDADATDGGSGGNVGTCAQMIGCYVWPSAFTGTVADYRGVYVRNEFGAVAGVVGNAVGLYIDAMSGLGATGSVHAIYVESGVNYLGTSLTEAGSLSVAPGDGVTPSQGLYAGRALSTANKQALLDAFLDGALTTVVSDDDPTQDGADIKIWSVGGPGSFGNFVWLRSGGTVASPTYPAGDNLDVGGMFWTRWDGTPSGGQTMAGFRVRLEPSNPDRCYFQWARFSGGFVEHMRLTPNGQLLVGAGVPNAVAQFQVDSTTRGALLPRMSTAERDAIATPPEGLLLFNTSTHALNQYTGTAWVGLSGAGSGTVTSVNVSGGTTGLTAAGGPVVGSGTITLSGILVVANGGTGAAAQTAYAVLCGGTTSTGAFQSVSGVGTSGQVLTSNGAGALPTWQAGGGGGTTLPVADTQTIVKGSADASKLLRFEVDGFTTGTTRVLTPPNLDGTIAVLQASNAFTKGNQSITPAASTEKGLTITMDPLATANGLEVVRSGGTASAFVVDGAGRVQVGVGASAGACLTAKSSSVVTTALRLEVANAGETLFSAGGSGIISVDASGIGAGRWILQEDGKVGYGQPSPQARLDVAERSADTAVATRATFITGHNSTGTPAAGFGFTNRFQAETTTTENTALADVVLEWATATHASRKGRYTLKVYDTAAREVLRGEADGTNPMVGFLGAAATTRPTVTGSRGGNAALASLLAALASLGLITDSSSA